MSYLDVKAILERAEKATPGPWVKTRQEGAGGYVWVDTRADVPEGEACILEMQNTVRDEADAAFIAAARADVPALCAEVERLRSEVAKLEEHLTEADESKSSMVSARDLTIRDLRFDLKLMTQDRDSGNEALAASAEALRVEREKHAGDIEATMLDARAAFGAATKMCREQLREVCRVLEANDIEAADCAADRVMARVRSLTADNERLRAALASIGKNICGREPLAAAYARGVLAEALAPTPTGGKEHE